MYTLHTITKCGHIPKNFTGIVEYASTKTWFVDGKCHRLDGPAIEYPSGSKEWFVDGLRHRVDGPAIEYADGSKQWWIEGNKITELEHKALVAKQTNTVPTELTVDMMVVVNGKKYKLVSID